MLVELMGLVRDSGFSWKNDWYTDDKFAKKAVTTFTSYTYVGFFYYERGFVLTFSALAMESTTERL